MLLSCEALLAQAVDGPQIPRILICPDARQTLFGNQVSCRRPYHDPVFQIQDLVNKHDPLLIFQGQKLYYLALHGR